MTSPEYKTQILKTADQWNSGLLYRLEVSKDGVTLHSVPTFSEWLEPMNGPQALVSGLAVDPCGRVYWLEGERVCHRGRRLVDWHVCRYDFANREKEKIVFLYREEYRPDAGSRASRILVDRFTLWLLDHANGRLVAFSTDSFQVKYVIERPQGIIDAALSADGHLYVLARDGKYRICKYLRNGRPVYRRKSGIKRRACFGSRQLEDPVGLAVGRENRVYVMDRALYASGEFHLFSSDGDEYQRIKELPDRFSPALIATNAAGVVFMADGEDRPAVHLFDADGSHLEEVHIPEEEVAIGGRARRIEKIYQIVCNPKGGLFLLTNAGIALFASEGSRPGERAFYYSKTLDNGEKGGLWHRLQLKGQFPPRTRIEVYYQVSNEAALKNLVEDILADGHASPRQKAESLDKLLKPTWAKPAVFEGSDDALVPRNNVGDQGSNRGSGAGTFTLPRDMLLQKNSGQYLWLKLELSTFHEKNKPIISELTVYSPRKSYLRYLPATYQEDPVSRDFLERFLSLFETVFTGVEVQIDRIFEHFDPHRAPATFLAWLGTWLNLAVEEGWPDERKRQLIATASELFRQKGTPAGLAKIVELYTGASASILEDSLVSRPLVLGQREIRLGLNTFLTQSPVRGFRLGYGVVLGRTAIRDVAEDPLDSFLHGAHRFTVLLDMDTEQFAQYETGVRRIVEEQKPAHTQYRLVLLGDSAFGQNNYVGITTKVRDYRPFRLGVTSRLGLAVAAIKGEKGARLERNTRLAGGMELI